VRRVRGPGGAIPVIPSYDTLERTWLPPMPLLFQRPVFTENRRLSRHFIHDVLSDLVAAPGLTDAEGRPLKFSPHDFRRLFVTDAVMNGLPPHIAQVICGHRDINTTMGYKAAPGHPCTRSSRTPAPEPGRRWSGRLAAG
jgi:integrase